MKCSKALAILKHGWYMVSQKGSHLKLKHPERKEILILHNHGSRELGKGLLKKLFKKAGIN